MLGTCPAQGTGTCPKWASLLVPIVPGTRNYILLKSKEILLIYYFITYTVYIIIKIIKLASTFYFSKSLSGSIKNIKRHSCTNNQITIESSKSSFVTGLIRLDFVW